jgi:hypothetical protein
MEILGRQLTFSDNVLPLDAIELLLREGKITEGAALAQLYTGKLYLPRRLCEEVLGLSSENFIDCHTFVFLLLIRAGLINIPETEIPNKSELLSVMQYPSSGKAQSYMSKIRTFVENAYNKGTKFKIGLTKSGRGQGWNVADRMRILAGTITHTFMDTPHSRYVQITARGGNACIHSFFVIGGMESQQDLICLEVKGLNESSPRIVTLSWILQEYCSGLDDSKEVVLSSNLPKITSDELPLPDEVACLQNLLGSLAKSERH